jgi:hypothetical protein
MFWRVCESETLKNGGGGKQARFGPPPNPLPPPGCTRTTLRPEGPSTAHTSGKTQTKSFVKTKGGGVLVRQSIDRKPFAPQQQFCLPRPRTPTELAKLDQVREGIVEELARRLGSASAFLCLSPRRVSPVGPRHRAGDIGRRSSVYTSRFVRVILH